MGRPPSDARGGVLRGIVVGGFLAGLLAFSSCGGDEPYAFDDATCAEAIKAGNATEAADWLRAPGPKSKQFGRFSTNGSLSMASLFEAYGATNLWVTGINEIKGDVPALSASAVVIGLPTDPRKRHQVFVMYAKESRLEEYEPHADTGQKYLLLKFRP